MIHFEFSIKPCQKWRGFFVLVFGIAVDPSRNQHWFIISN